MAIDDGSVLVWLNIWMNDVVLTLDKKGTVRLYLWCELEFEGTGYFRCSLYAVL